MLSRLGEKGVARLLEALWNPPLLGLSTGPPSSGGMRCVPVLEVWT